MDVRQPPVSYRTRVGRGSGGSAGEWAGCDHFSGSDPTDRKERCRKSDLTDLARITASFGASQAMRRDVGRRYHDAINAVTETTGPMYETIPSPAAA